jgi:hypothetical protein
MISRGPGGQISPGGDERMLLAHSVTQRMLPSPKATRARVNETCHGENLEPINLQV